MAMFLIIMIVMFMLILVFWQLGGAALLGFGLWMKFDPTITHYLNVIDVHQSADLLDHAATIFCVVGGLAFIAGLVGCCGLCRASQCLLFSVTYNIHTSIKSLIPKIRYFFHAC